MREVVIIGGGQAGLSMSCHLQVRGISHQLLEANPRIGDNWRNRWDSLSLFSPAKYDSLPGLPFPLPAEALPTKDQAADYLEQYAQHFNLPVTTNIRTERVRKEKGGFAIETSDGQTIQTKAVVIATGPFQTPRVPTFAEKLPSDILQLHTREYRNPSQLQEGPALVVGTGASGSQIALELSRTRKVYLAGRDLGSIPRSLLGKDIYWWLYFTGAIHLRWHSWLGSRLLKSRQGGDALVGTSLKKITQEGGLHRLEKATDCIDGQLTFACGKTAPDIRNVVWATGYANDFSWIELPVFNEKGQPIHERGVVKKASGLYFLGLKTLYRASSSTMGGVGNDAQYLAEFIQNKQ